MKLRLPLICGAGLALIGIEQACSSSGTVGPSSAAPLTKIVVTPNSAAVAVRGTKNFSATAQDAAGGTVTGVAFTWSSNNTSIATVDQSGHVTGVDTGHTKIQASAQGISGSATLGVTAAASGQDPVGSVTVGPAAPAVFVGQTTQLTAVTKDSAGNVVSGRTVRWSSRSPAVATVDSVSGVATGVAAGTSQMVATSEGVSATTTLTVTAAPANAVVLSPAVSHPRTGQTTTIVASVTDVNGKPIANPTVSFSSNALKVATITRQHGDSAQVLAGPNAGTATITGTSQGHSGTASLIVSAVADTAVPASISLQINPDSVVAIPNPLDVLIQVSATVKTASGRVLSNFPVVFTSTDPPVSGFLGMGVDTVVGGSITIAPDANGHAVITATAGKVSTHGTLTVCYEASPPMCGPLASIKVVPPTDTVTLGDSVQMAATGIDSSGKAYSNLFVEWQSGQVVSSASSQVILVEPNGEVDGLNLGSQFVVAGVASFNGQGEITVVSAPPGAVMASTPGYEERRARLIAAVTHSRQRALDARNRRRQEVRQQLLNAMVGVSDASTMRTYRRMVARREAQR